MSRRDVSDTALEPLGQGLSNAHLIVKVRHTAHNIFAYSCTPPHLARFWNSLLYFTRSCYVHPVRGLFKLRGEFDHVEADEAKNEFYVWKYFTGVKVREQVAAYLL